MTEEKLLKYALNNNFTDLEEAQQMTEDTFGIFLDDMKNIFLDVEEIIN